MPKHSNGGKRRRPDVRPVSVIKADTSKEEPKHFFAVSFQFITHDFDCKRFSAKQLEGVLERLSNLSKMEWDQIYKAGRHGLGSEFVNEGELKFTVPTSMDSDHAGRPISLRNGDGNKAMVGKRVGDIFQLLCVECNYGDAYDHGGS